MRNRNVRKINKPLNGCCVQLRKSLHLAHINIPLSAPMQPTEVRRERLRALIQKSSVSKLATQLGYRQPSFLSQMAGPNPTREITEKTARRFERDLKLPDGYLDQPLEAEAAPKQETNGEAPAETALVADVIRLVGNICSGEDITLPPMKFADVVALAYVDTMEHNKRPRPDHIKQLVRLLK
jgi:hypothetical protein